jgi:hypothetical protein
MIRFDTPIFQSSYLPKSELDSLKEGFLARGNSSAAVDAVNVLYLIEIRKNTPHYQHTRRINYPSRDSYNEMNKLSFIVDYPAPQSSGNFFGDTIAYQWNIASAKEHYLYQLSPSLSYHIFQYYSPIDISQVYVNFKVTTLQNHKPIANNPKLETISSLTFDFVGNTVFSEMSPSPDEINMHQIIFTDSTKIADIRENGIIFHADLTDNKNVQTARMFLVTTILSFLVAYWVKLFLQVIKNLSSKISKKRSEQTAKP